jgi:hypothetical protein
MKKSAYLVVLFVILTNFSFTQTDIFTAGWYQVLSNAQVKVINGNSSDVVNDIMFSDITYNANEVLLVFNFSKDVYYCHDPEGRLVLVKGKLALKKIDIIGRPGYITEEVKIGLDISLVQGNNVWIIGYNASDKTTQILLNDGSKVSIPQNSIQDLKDYFDVLGQDVEWKIVE